MPGEGLTPAQSRLCAVDNFTGMYKSRFENKLDVSGDIVVNPKRAIRLLKDRSRGELTIPTRPCDFRSEVEWRLSLRNVGEDHTF